MKPRIHKINKHRSFAYYTPEDVQKLLIQVSGLSIRQWRVVDFALYRMIGAAYDRADAAAQDKDGRYFPAGAVAQFHADAKDAEDLRSKIAPILEAARETKQ